MHGDTSLMQALLVALGGACGAYARYRTDAAVRAVAASSLPLGTLTVNVVGCFLLGLITGCHPSVLVVSALATGLCGGFTTFSTLSVDAVMLLAAKRWAAVAAYLTLTCALGYLAFLAGLLLVK